MPWFIIMHHNMVTCYAQCDWSYFSFVVRYTIRYTMHASYVLNVSRYQAQSKTMEHYNKIYKSIPVAVMYKCFEKTLKSQIIQHFTHRERRRCTWIALYFWQQDCEPLYTDRRLFEHLTPSSLTMSLLFRQHIWTNLALQTVVWNYLNLLITIYFLGWDVLRGSQFPFSK